MRNSALSTCWTLALVLLSTAVPSANATTVHCLVDGIGTTIAYTPLPWTITEDCVWTQENGVGNDNGVYAPVYAIPLGGDGNISFTTGPDTGSAPTQRNMAYAPWHTANAHFEEVWFRASISVASTFDGTEHETIVMEVQATAGGSETGLWYQGWNVFVTQVGSNFGLNFRRLWRDGNTQHAEFEVVHKFRINTAEWYDIDVGYRFGDLPGSGAMFKIKVDGVTVYDESGPDFTWEFNDLPPVPFKHEFGQYSYAMPGVRQVFFDNVRIADAPQF